MKHEMKLVDKYYNYILNGTKRIELRLYDEKRKKINIGDTITFLKYPNMDESFNVIVTELLRYSSFDNLIKDFDISILADQSMSKDELVNILNGFYSTPEQNKHGVLGIRFELKK